MALLSFPTSPANGQLYPTSPVAGQNQYQWDSANQTWRLLGPATGVAPGCYGDGTNVATFCVDAQGRITSAVNAPISSVIPDLQTVTTQGAATTDTIDVGGLIASSLTYPTTDGLPGQFLTTNGSGSLGWAFDTGYLQQVFVGGTEVLLVPTTSNTGFATIGVFGNRTAEIRASGSAFFNTLRASNLNYPTTDGTTNQVIKTDGAGNLGWLTTLRVVAAPTMQGDPGVAGDVAYDATYFYYFDGANWQRIAADPIPW